METLFMACLIGGVLFAIVTVVFGDWLGQALDGALELLSLDGPAFLSPMTLVGGITMFGGTGLLLLRYSELGGWAIVLLALAASVVTGIAVFFLYVKPMEESENSIAFTLQSLSGAIGEVLVPIPAEGCGEILLKVGAGFTNQIGASFDRVPISEGAKVVVVEVKDSVLYVAEIQLNQ